MREREREREREGGSLLFQSAKSNYEMVKSVRANLS